MTHNSSKSKIVYSFGRIIPPIPEGHALSITSVDHVHHDLRNLSVKRLILSGPITFEPPACLESLEADRVCDADIRKMPNLRELKVGIWSFAGVPESLRSLEVSRLVGMHSKTIDCTNLETLKVHPSYYLANTKNLKTLHLKCDIEGFPADGRKPRDLTDMESLTTLVFEGEVIPFVPPSSVRKFKAKYIYTTHLHDMPNLKEVDVDGIFGKLTFKHPIEMLKINGARVENSCIDCSQITSLILEHNYELTCTQNLRFLSIGPHFNLGDLIYSFCCSMSSLKCLQLIGRELIYNLHMFKHIEILTLINCHSISPEFKIPRSVKKIVQIGSRFSVDAGIENVFA